MSKTVQIDHFSDTLCVWAYVSQVRVDELTVNLGERVNIDYHFINMFGNTRKRISEGWKDRGGQDGFAAHVLEVGESFPHVEINPSVWKDVSPVTSALSHIFLKSLQLLERLEEVGGAPLPELQNRTPVEQAIWMVRDEFFRHARDISQLSVLMNIAEQLDLPIGRIESLLTNGEAMAELCSDLDLREQHRLEGSPTYLMNNGRQKLYGNVGYRIIEANVLELLEHPEGGASWC